MKLSPADDVIINVERSLRIQEFQKVLVSIVAKKVCMGITNVLIDLPYGKGSKVESPDDVAMLDRQFRKLFKKFGIECETIRRPIKGPDGRSIGPNLEIREALRLLERTENRSLELEKVILEMAGKIFENTKKARIGEGKEMAEEILDSGRALEKFWEIAFAQGATKRVVSTDIHGGKLRYSLLSDRDGVIKRIDNVSLVTIARALGSPIIKEAGIRIEKMPGESVKKGEPLLTLCATTENRLLAGRGFLDIDRLFTF